MFGSKSKKTEVKRWHLILLGVTFLLAIAYNIYGSYWPKATVEIGGQSVRVLLADTLKHRFQGCSNKDSLGKYGGMLFVFPNRDRHAMVMRQMKFSLDIIWIDGRTIVDMAPGLSPDPSQTEVGLQPYLPRLPATLVLELPAGFVQKYGLKIGDQVKIVK